MKYLLLALACAGFIDAVTVEKGSDKFTSSTTSSNQLESAYPTYTPEGEDSAELPQTGITTDFDFSFSKDGSRMAFQLPDNDSELRRIVIMHVTDGSVPDDTLADVIFSSLYWKGNEGIFYNRYYTAGIDTAVTGRVNKQVFYHELGTRQSDDKAMAQSLNHTVNFVSIINQGINRPVN